MSESHCQSDLRDPLLKEEDLFEKEAQENTSTWLMTELKAQLWLAGPMILVNILQYSLTVVSLMFVGHLGELVLASASIATSLATVTGYSVMIGMGSCLETLCGQAYGARQYRSLGVYLQRGMLVLNLLAIPIACIWAYIGPLLRAMGQRHEIADGAGHYAKWLIPSLFAYANMEPLVKFLQAQSRVLPMTVISSVTLCVHIPLSYLLVFKVGLGAKGAAIAYSMSEWLNVAFLITYVKLFPTFKETWNGFTSEALHELGTFVKLAVPSTIMICLEFWSFQLMVLLSGLMPNPELEMSAFSICLNTMVLVYMIPSGLSAALSTRVSNALGAGRPKAARASVGLGMSLALMEGFLIASLLVSTRNIWPKAYSNDSNVINYVSSMVPVIALMTWLDAFQGVLSGVARGCGWQHLGVYANLTAYYLIGIPLALTLGFKLHYGGRGIWLGLLVGIIVQGALLAVITCTTNWAKQAKMALNRVRHDVLNPYSHFIEKESTSSEP